MDELTKRLVESFISGGIPGTILAFILWKIAPAVSKFRDDIVASLRENRDESTKALRRLEEAVHRRAVVDLMRLAADPALTDRMREAARELVKEIGDAEEERRKEDTRADSDRAKLEAVK